MSNKPDTTAVVTAQHLERYLSLVDSELIANVKIDLSKGVAIVSKSTDKQIVDFRFKFSSQDHPIVTLGREIMSNLNLRSGSAGNHSHEKMEVDWHTGHLEGSGLYEVYSSFRVEVPLTKEMQRKLDAAATLRLKEDQELPSLQSC